MVLQSNALIWSFLLFSLHRSRAASEVEILEVAEKSSQKLDAALSKSDSTNGMEPEACLGLADMKIIGKLKIRVE